MLTEDMKKKSMRNILAVTFILGGLFCAAAWWLYFQFPQGSAPLVLHFRVGSGADLLGAREAIRTIPLLASVMLLLNAGLSFIFRWRDKNLSLLFGIATVLFEGFFLLALAVLLFANRS